MVSDTFSHRWSPLLPPFSAQVNLLPQRLMRFDEVIPSLKEIDSLRVHLAIFTAVHALTDESSQRVANGEIESFYVSCIYFTTLISTKQSQYIVRFSKYNTLDYFDNSAVLFTFAYLSILQMRIGN